MRAPPGLHAHVLREPVPAGPAPHVREGGAARRRHFIVTRTPARHPKSIIGAGRFGLLRPERCRAPCPSAPFIAARGERRSSPVRSRTSAPNGQQPIRRPAVLPLYGERHRLS